MKNHNKTELQNIAINQQIDYKDFSENYRNCTNEPYFYLTLDTTRVPADNPIKCRKNFRFSIIKMTLSEQVKILDDKIKANKTQYDLDREAGKISALSSGELEKH